MIGMPFARVAIITLYRLQSYWLTILATKISINKFNGNSLPATQCLSPCQTVAVCRSSIVIVLVHYWKFKFTLHSHCFTFKTVRTEQDFLQPEERINFPLHSTDITCSSSIIWHIEWLSERHCVVGAYAKHP